MKKMTEQEARKLAQKLADGWESLLWTELIDNLSKGILTACTAEAADCEARAVAIDEQNQRLRKFIFELCPHETYLATSMGWIRDQIARASDCEALRAELREARLEVADDIFRVLVAGEDKKCAEVVSWLMRYIDDIAAMKGAK